MTRDPRLYLQDIAETIHAIENYNYFGIGLERIWGVIQRGLVQLYGKPALLRPFEIHQLTGLGEDLAPMVMDAPDQGHRSDMQATNRWAE